MERTTEPPVKKWLLPLSWIYAGIQRVYHALYDLGVFREWHPPIPLIGIGSIQLGGTGKTPATILLAQILHRYLPPPWNRVGIVNHGYRAKRSRQTCVVLFPEKKQELWISSRNAGDEALLTVRQTHLPLVRGKRRKECIRKFLTEIPDLKVLIADDILQHRRVKPALRLLTTSWDRPFWQDAFFPAGYRRDGIWVMRKCHGLLVTYAPPGKDGRDIRQILKEDLQAPDALVEFWMERKVWILEHTPIRVIPADQWWEGRETHEITPSPKRGEWALVAGIARPGRWIRLWKKYWGDPDRIFQYPDHHCFVHKDLKEWIEWLRGNSARKIVLTEKDMIRLKNWWDKPPLAFFRDRFFVGVVRLRVQTPKLLAEWVFSHIVGNRGR